MGYFDGLGGVSVQEVLLRLVFLVCLPFWWWMEEEPSLSLMALIQDFEYDAEGKDEEKLTIKLTVMLNVYCTIRRMQEEKMERMRKIIAEKSHTSNGLHGCVCGNTDCQGEQG